jgi:thiol:disulfide interchange protein DsbD
MGSHGLGMVLLLFFAGGLLLAFTPCVFPMIPILSGIIAGADNPGAGRGFMLSSAYVLGVAVPYTVAGLLVAMFGAGMNLQYILQQPAAIIVSTIIFVVLALAMFGLYELQLPAALRNRLNSMGEGRNGGSLWGAGLIGAISALVVSPCVTPILAGALVYVAASGDALTGALSLFALSMGMGFPLIMFGTGGGHLLPKAGAWMEDIKRFFGVLMLGVAVWLLGRVIPASLTLALYGLLLTSYGVWLGALEPVQAGQSRLKRTLALVMALYGAIMLVGAAGGGTDPLQPLDRPAIVVEGATTATATQGAWLKVKGSDALQQQLDQARRDGQPVLVDFYADWCAACKVLEEKTLNQSDVLAALAKQNYRLIKADITEVNRDNQGIMQRFGIIGLPCLIFFDSNGNEVAGSRILGEMGPESFVLHMKTKVSAANTQ